ncbi:2-oxoglutarate-dependent dioxygenase 19 [Linum perenne]
MVQIEAVVVDGQVPTIDYLSLFSTDHVKCSAALARLSTACQDYGFFNLVNHGIPDGVIEGALSGIAEFYEQVEVHEKNKYSKGDPKAKILWDARYHGGYIAREHLKLLARPELHCPPNPPSLRCIFNKTIKLVIKWDVHISTSVTNT